MRKAVLILGLILLTFSLSGTAIAQNTRSYDSDSLAVSTSVAWGKYTTRWETAVFKFVGCEGQLKIAFSAIDTTWSDKTFFIMPANSSLTVTKNKELGIPGVYRIQYKCTSGTGALLITGTRTSDT